MNISTPIQSPIEIIKVTRINPLISRCQIKVCYVGEDPNRNRSIITKDVAKEIANSLPGSPIVGYYNEDKEDFEEHNRILEISNGEIKMKDTTRPYGFVDLNATVWFQKFLDDGIEHEYLVTEGYLWTGQYPEAQRVIDRGNNQSMELDEKNIDAYWTKDNKGRPQFFIINEAIISKLCILGESVEPCFEGAQITKFSLNDSFKEELFSLVNQMKEILEKGGSPMPTVDNTVIIEEGVDNLVNPQDDAVIEEPAPVVEEPVIETEPAAEPVIEEDPAAEPVIEAEPAAEPTYSLEDIPEYVELSNRFSELESNYNELVANHTALNAQYEELVTFRNSIQREKKEAMINSFYMLSEEDKKDVLENIDTYSLDEIEAKLSIICVRNRVNFSLEDEEPTADPVVYNVNGSDGSDNGSTPAWIKAIQAVAKR